MRKYKAIFFDWDGTAVESRKAPVEDAVARMRALLAQKVNLIIISGTTYENIAGGKLHEYFSVEELEYLYLGLGRGALNYSFTEGKPVLHDENLPSKTERLMIHKIAFEIHQTLLEKHDLNTDIVFSRPNYCKLDLMVDHNRHEKLFLQIGEIKMAQDMLKEHGIAEGLSGVVSLAAEAGKAAGIEVKPTTDAKYLEVGTTTKSDNVDYFVKTLLKMKDIQADDVCFWGDEFTFLDEGIKGSDAYMITESVKSADFYDVSATPWKLPDMVESLGGSTKTFLNFLEKQAQL